MFLLDTDTVIYALKGEVTVAASLHPQSHSGQQQPETFRQNTGIEAGKLVVNNISR